MTNSRKSYSVSALAILALAFCVFMVSQAVMAAKDKRLNDAVVIQSAEGTIVPLPTVDLLGSRTALNAEVAERDLDQAVEYTGKLDPSALGKTIAPRHKSVDPKEIRVGAALAGGGDTPADATEITALPYTDNGVLGAAADDYPLDCGLGDPGNGDIFYKYTPTENQRVTFSMCSTDDPYKDFLMGLWEGDPAAGGTMVVCDEEACTAPTDGTPRIDAYPLSVGHIYYIQIKGWSIGDGTYRLDVFDPFADAFAGADLVEGEACGDHTNDGCYMSVYDAAEDVGALGVGSHLLVGTTYRLPGTPPPYGTYGPGSTRDADQWRFTMSAGGMLVWDFMAEVDMAIFLHYYPTDGSCVGESLVTGTNRTVPAYTLLHLQAVLFPGTTYTFSLRSNNQEMDCTGAPDGGAPRYFVNFEVLDMTLIDDCGLATEITGPTLDGTVSTWTQSLAGMSSDGPVFCPYEEYGLTYTQNVWWRLHCVRTGFYTISTCNTAPCMVDSSGVLVQRTPDLMLGVFQDGCPVDECSELDASDDDCGGDVGTSQGSFFGIAGNYYLITVGVFPWSACLDPTVRLDISKMHADPLNDLCANRQDLGTGPGHYFVHNLDFTLDGPATTYCAPGGGICADAWYTWTASTNGRVTFDMCRGAQPMIFDNTLELYRGSECLTTNPRDPDPFGCSDDGCGRFSSGALVDVTCTAGEEFLIRMAGWFGPNTPCNPGGYGFGYMDIYESPNGIRPPNDACINAGTPIVLTDGVPVQVSGDLTNSSWDNCPGAYDQTVGPFQFPWNTFHAIEVSNCSDVTIDFCGNTETGYERVTFGGEPGEYQLFGGCPCEGDYIRFRATSWNKNACTGYPADQDDNNTWYFEGLIPGVYIVEVSAYALGTRVPGTLPLYTRPYVINFLATEIPCTYLFNVSGETYPTNVVDHTPQIAWTWVSDLSFQQSEFQIEVGSDNDWTVAEMWDPDVFVSADSQVVYAGAALLDGDSYYVRLRTKLNGIWTPWYETSFRMNSLPAEPTVASPHNGSHVGPSVALYVNNATDPEGDPLQYQFEVYRQPQMVDLVAQSDLMAEQTDSTGWTVNAYLEENKLYFWRCRAWDGYEYSDWSLVQFFCLDATPEAPPRPALTAPFGENLIVYDMLPTFSWTEVDDPDPLDEVKYRMELAVDKNFTWVASFDGLTQPSYQFADSLLFGTHYWWRVKAFDLGGLFSVSDTADFWSWTLGDVSHNHDLTLGDIMILVDHLFISGAPISPRKVGDVNSDCIITLGDIMRMVDRLFISGSELLVGCE